MKEKEYGVRLRWLCASCYEIVCGDTHIVTDPYITHCETTDLTWEAIERCDILALTHNHWDHMTDIPSLMARFNPLLLCPEQSMIYLAKWLNCCPSRIYPMYADVELDFGDVKVRPLYTRHIRLTRNHRSICDALDRNPVNEKVPGMIDVQHIGNLDCRSYLFTLKNGTKVLYWLGNLSKEQYTLCAALKPDIAILQRAVKDKQFGYFEESLVEIIRPRIQELSEPTSDSPLLPDSDDDIYYQGHRAVSISQRDMLMFKNVGTLLTERTLNQIRPLAG